MEDFYTLQLARFNPRDQQLLKFVRGKAESFLASVGPSYFYGVQKDASATVSSLMLSHMQTSADKPAFDPFAFLPASAHESLLAGQTKDSYNAYVVSTRALVYRLVQLLPAEAVITKLVPAVANDTMFAQMYFGRQEHFNLETFVRKTTMHASAAGPQKHVLFVRATLASLYISQVVEKWSADLRAATTVIESEQCQQQRLFEDALRGFVTDARKRMIFIVVNATISREKTTDRVSYMRQVIDDTIYSVQSKLANADAIAAKHFVILLAFPPEQMYISSCYPAVYLRGWQFQFFDTLDSGGAFYIERFAKTLYGVDNRGDENVTMNPEKVLFETMLSDVLFEFSSHLRPPFEKTNLPLALLTGDVATVYDLQKTAKVRAAALHRAMGFVSTIWGQLMTHMSSAFDAEAVRKLIQSQATAIITGQDFQSLTDGVASVLQRTLRAFLMIVLHEIASDFGLQSMVELEQATQQEALRRLFKLVPLPDSKTLANFQPSLLYLSGNMPCRLFLFKLIWRRIENACKAIRDKVSAEQNSSMFIGLLKAALEKDPEISDIFQDQKADGFVMQAFIYDVIAVRSGIVNNTEPEKLQWLVKTLRRWTENKASELIKLSSSGVHVLAIIVGTLDLHAKAFQSLSSSGINVSRGGKTDVLAGELERLHPDDIEDKLLLASFEKLWDKHKVIVADVKNPARKEWDDVGIAHWIDELHFLSNHFGPGELLPGVRFKEYRIKIDVMLIVAQFLLLDSPAPDRATLAGMLDALTLHTDKLHLTENVLSMDEVVGRMVRANASPWVADILRWFARTANEGAIGEPRNARRILSAVHTLDKLSPAQILERRNTHQYIFQLIAEAVSKDDLAKLVAETLAKFAGNETATAQNMHYLANVSYLDRKNMPKILKSPLADFFYEHVTASFDTLKKSTAELASLLLQAHQEHTCVRVQQGTQLNNEQVIRSVLGRAICQEKVYCYFLAYLASFPPDTTVDNLVRSFSTHGLNGSVLRDIYIKLTSNKSNDGRLLLIARLQQAKNRDFAKALLNHAPLMDLVGEDRETYCLYFGDPAKKMVPLEDVPSFMATATLPNWPGVEVPFPHLYELYPRFSDQLKQAAKARNFAPFLKWCEDQRKLKLKDGECHMLIVLEVHHHYLQEGGVANLAQLAPLKDLIANNDASTTRQLGLDRFPDHRRALLTFLDPTNYFADWTKHQLGQLFCKPVHELDWDSVRHRHIAANIVALTMGSNNREHPIWTFLFCPEILKLTHPFGWYYTDYVIEMYHYDCGTIVLEDGTLSGARANTIQRPAAYAVSLFTHIALAWALCMEPSDMRERTALLYPNILSIYVATGLHGDNERAKMVHLPFSRVASVWYHIADKRRPREDMPLLVNRALERYAWSASKGVPQYKKSYSSVADVVAAETAFTAMYNDTVAHLTDFRINMADIKRAEMEQFTGEFISSRRDLPGELLQSMNSISTNEHYELLHAFNTLRTDLHLLRELPPILALYDLLHYSMHGLVTEEETMSNPLQYFYDKDLIRPMDSPIVVDEVMTQGVEAFNRVHTKLGGMLQGGVCATKDDFVKIDPKTTSLAYLLTHPIRDEENDVLIKVMRALIAKSNTLLEKGKNLLERVFEVAKRDPAQSEIWNDRPLKLLLIAIRQSINNSVSAMDTVTFGQSSRLLITADADSPKYLTFQALAESMRKVVLKADGTEDTAAPATFDLTKLQQLVLAQEVIGRHSLHLLRVRRAFVYRKAGTIDHKEAVGEQGDIVTQLNHENLANFNNAFDKDKHYATLNSLDALGQEDLRRAIGDLHMAVNTLRDMPAGQLPQPGSSVRDWLKSEANRDNLAWCPESLQFQHLCWSVRNVKDNLDRHTGLFTRLPELLRKPIPGPVREAVQAVIDEFVQTHGLAETIEIANGALSVLSEAETEKSLGSNAATGDTDHTIAGYCEMMGEENKLLLALPVDVLDVNYADTYVEFLNGRGRLLKRQLDEQSAARGGNNNTGNASRWSELDGVPNLILVNANKEEAAVPDAETAVGEDFAPVSVNPSGADSWAFESAAATAVPSPRPTPPALVLPSPISSPKLPPPVLSFVAAPPSPVLPKSPVLPPVVAVKSPDPQSLIPPVAPLPVVAPKQPAVAPQQPVAVPTQPAVALKPAAAGPAAPVHRQQAPQPPQPVREVWQQNLLNMLNLIEVDAADARLLQQRMDAHDAVLKAIVSKVDREDPIVGAFQVLNICFDPSHAWVQQVIERVVVSELQFFLTDEQKDRIIRLAVECNPQILEAHETFVQDDDFAEFHETLLS